MIPPYSPSLPDWMRQVSSQFSTISPLVDPSSPIVHWGNLYGNGWDGTSDAQAMFGQTQSTWLANGSLGAIYGQRIASYSGGAANDGGATVVGAVRGYNQVSTSVTYAVESGALFITDNYAYLAQGAGVYGQTNTRHGGRGWGAVLEVNEYAETFTATAGQTVFVVPNGFNAVAAVTKNGTLLTLTTQYTISNPNVTLVSGASAGDIIKVYRANPAFGQIGAEIDCFAGPGTDTANATSGNRIGAAIFGYRQDKSIALASHIGTLLALISDPADTANLTVDRGVQFQGHFGIGVDFTAASASFDTYLIKFPQGGFQSSQIMQLGDNTSTIRVQCSAGSGGIVGTETNIDTLFWRNATEIIRLNGTSGATGGGVKMTLIPASTSYASDAAAATGGVPVGGVYRNGSALMVRIT